ncbi:MAG: hypothetical protein ACFBSG_16615 [Leptolyngbyaceae cyanobacterium]
MKHASPAALEALAPLLERVRHYIPPLKEKAVGKFYLKSSAFLHFHEDPAGLFADLKVNGEWQRYAVNTESEYVELLTAIAHQASLAQRPKS